MSLNIELKNQLESSILDLNLPENPYFKSLTSGEMTHEQFLNSQLEFASMVYFFSRPMAQIIANISDPISRIALVGNLWEEHGQGIKENVHGNTILTLIERLGGDISSIDLQNPLRMLGSLMKHYVEFLLFVIFVLLLLCMQVLRERLLMYRA